jgi:NAD-dependent deacetylase
MHRLRALVTQNIDGLHQAAGMQDSRVIEMHGTNRWVECLACGLRSEPGPAVSAFRKNQCTPRCDCGGFLKFATISFGQSLRPEVLAQAIAAVEGADLLLALGSTLAVYPAAELPVIAARRGILVAIVNQGPTEQDQLATVKIDGDVSAILPPLISSVASAGAVDPTTG